jgi:NADH:ubiquinone oxidoreductase subunit 6 (subunit J)
VGSDDRASAVGLEKERWPGVDAVGGKEMVGMLQILTYLLAVYLVMKGVEIFQIGFSSSRQDRSVAILVGVLSLAACIVAAAWLVMLQDQQASALSNSMPQLPR